MCQLHGRAANPARCAAVVLNRHRPYPDYLLEDSCRIANSAHSFQALSVGSISLTSYYAPPYSSISQKDKPSAFSCSGLGIWETIKPEVVEYGGDLVKDEAVPPSIIIRQDVCPELVRSTLSSGPESLLTMLEHLLQRQK